jgi:hypothetical protein
MADPSFRGAATEVAHARLSAALAILDADGTAALRDKLGAVGIKNGKDVDETLAAHAQALAVLGEALATQLAPVTTTAKGKQGGPRE